MSKQTRINVEHINGLPALRMTWSADTQTDDVIVAYNEIMSYLNSTDIPLDVIVDLQQAPYLPMREAVVSALEGPYTHEMLRKWLIVGGEGLAHDASNLLYGITGEQKILWFLDVEDAEDYIHASNLLKSN